MKTLEQNELECELYEVIKNLVIHHSQGLSRTATVKKARAIYHEVISNHLYAGAVQ